MDNTVSLKYVIENLEGLKRKLPYSEAVFVYGLIQDLTKIKNKIGNYEDAMNWFCDRVERREILSKDTYTVFCNLLGREIRIKG